MVRIWNNSDPSIAWWNRLEPSPRSNDLVLPLAARVADGLWFLTRQWQLTEFEGVDGGSPAWIEVDTTTDRLSDAFIQGQLIPLDRSSPVEMILGEPRPFDLATSVELGQMFESMMESAGLGALAIALRGTYAIAAAGPPHEQDDAEARRFRAVVAGRALDGAAIYEAAKSSVFPGADPALPAVLQQYVGLVDELRGDPKGDVTWNAERLEHEVDLVVRNTGAHYTSHPAGNGDVTWDTMSAYKALIGVPPIEPSSYDILTLLPASVRFRGGEPQRWWTFDASSMDYGAIDAERRDFPRLLLADYLLRQASDTYVIPIEQLVGTVMHINNVLVRDVFGTLFVVPPSLDAQGRRSMFSIGGPLASGDHLVVPTGSSFIQYGEPIEEIRFTRDDMMNMVWALEESIEGSLGQPFSRYDVSREHAGAAVDPPPGPNALVYRLQTNTPEHWIPFVPVARGGEVMFESAGAPMGRLLRPSPQPYRIAEEELRRGGIRLRRAHARCRGTRGETYVWIARQIDIAPQIDSPAPRYDPILSREVAEPAPAVPEPGRGSTSLIQSTFGQRGNFEVVVPAPGGGLAHYWRDNDDPLLPWHGPNMFATDIGVVDAVTLIQSTFGSLEVIVRVGDRLAHMWRSPSQEWSGAEFLVSGISGTPSFIQGNVGSPPNFEVVAPLAGGGIAHFWRDNQTFQWSPSSPFALGLAVDDVSLVHSTFGNLEVIARIGDRLAHFWRDASTFAWSGALFFTSGVSGSPSFIQSRTEPRNFEVVAPLATAAMLHLSRNNQTMGWSQPVVFGEGSIHSVSLIQSNFDGNFELIARAGTKLLHYWRGSSPPFAWNGPTALIQQ